MTNMQKSDAAAPSPTSSGPYCLPGTRSFLLPSATGDAYRIDIAIPDAPAPAPGWPAVYLLDASGCFATAVEALRRMQKRPDATGVSPAVIVGISSSDGYDPRRRERDYGLSAGAAGADAFLAYLLDRVKPLAAAQAPLDGRRDTLFGHSLAGCFALRVLAGHAPAFHRYAAISPSIWAAGEPLFDAVAALATQDRHALICVGEWEDELPPWQTPDAANKAIIARRAERGMVRNARRIAQSLAAALGEEHVRFRLLADEDHASIVSAAIPHLLRLSCLP